MEQIQTNQEEDKFKEEDKSLTSPSKVAESPVTVVGQRAATGSPKPPSCRGRGEAVPSPQIQTNQEEDKFKEEDKSLTSPSKVAGSPATVVGQRVATGSPEPPSCRGRGKAATR